MFKGFISLSGDLEEARKDLLSLGFTIEGPGHVVFDKPNAVTEYPVSCTEKVLESIDGLFGQLVWSLDRIEE